MRNLHFRIFVGLGKCEVNTYIAPLCLSRDMLGALLWGSVVAVNERCLVIDMNICVHIYFEE
jgi:hypothetical protein